MTARNRFIACHSHDAALRLMEYQSVLCLDAVATVNEWPWIYTNAGVLAEACAHWAFVAHPELRVEDES